MRIGDFNFLRAQRDVVQRIGVGSLGKNKDQEKQTQKDIFSRSLSDFETNEELKKFLKKQKEKETKKRKKQLDLSFERVVFSEEIRKDNVNLSDKSMLQAKKETKKTQDVSKCMYLDIEENLVIAPICVLEKYLKPIYLA